MSQIARNSGNGRLNRNTFCSGAEVAPVQCKRGLKVWLRSCQKLSSHSADRLISMVVLHPFRDSERDAGGWVGYKWQFSRDLIIEHPLSAKII